jgi:pyruvate formate lyase activating enzyme
VIGRIGYDIRRWHLDAAGRCLSCGTQAAGVFDGAPGTWGNKRQPVRLAAFAKTQPAA